MNIKDNIIQKHITGMIGEFGTFTDTGSSTSSITLNSLYAMKKDIGCSNNGIKCIKVTQKGLELLKNVQKSQKYHLPDTPTVTGNASFCGLPVELDETVYGKIGGDFALEFDSILNYLKYCVKNDIKQVEIG